MGNKEEIFENIHEAAKLLKETIEKCAGDKKAVVFWGYVDGDTSIHGLTVSDNLTSRELEHAGFCLVGRAYNIIDYEE